MDLYVEIRKLDRDELINNQQSETSKDIKNRVVRARQIQYKRYGNNTTNANINKKLINKHCEIDNETKDLLYLAIDNLGLSARSYDKILKIGRTIADLENEENIQKKHILEALSYRKKY